MIKSTEEENIIGSTTPGYVKNAQEIKFINKKNWRPERDLNPRPFA